MALLWIDGFDNYGTTIGASPSPSGVFSRKYAVADMSNSVYIRNGRLGGYAIQLMYDATRYFSPGDITTNAMIVVGCAIKFETSWPTSSIQFMAFYDGSTKGMNVQITPTGQLAVYRGSTLLGTTTDAGIMAGVWFYLEFKVVCNSTTGSYELRIGGVNKLTASGVNTKAGTHDYHTTFRFTGTSVAGGSAVQVDDLYCVDSSGSINNDFLGNMRVVTIRPDAAGDSTQFTPDSGSNYARVNEQVCGDDSNYVEASISGYKDLYNYEALSGITSDIKGIMVNTDCRESDATSYSLITVCKSGVTESDNTAQLIGSSSYITRRRLLETDPNTSAAWTKNNLDAAQFGVKVA